MEMQEQHGGMVLACMVEQCSWWNNRQCHAQQIEVGESHPSCDTYTTGSQVNQVAVDEPPVSACMVQECKFNSQGKMCDAPGITVGHHADHADCGTFVPMR